jgi:hypothetical protein
MTNLAFIKHRMALRLQGTMDIAGGSDVLVTWVETAGGTIDTVTGAVVDGVQTPASGVMRALGIEEPARSVVRQFAEIQAGDLILEVDAAATLTKPDGSTVALDDLDAPRFQWADNWYVQKEVGEALAASWNAVVAGQKLYRTLLLRRVT